MSDKKWEYKFTKIGRRLYNESISDADALKALALLVFVKHNTPTGTITDFSYYKLAKMSGLHKNTVKKRINILEQSNLITFVGKNKKHLVFKKVRAPKSNIDITKLDMSSIKSIEMGLRALLIVEIQNRKNYVQQRIIKVHSTKNSKKFNKKGELKEYKAAMKFCNQGGYTWFSDNGISYRKIRTTLGVGNTTVVNMIKYGQKNWMFHKFNHINLYRTNINNAQLFINSNNKKNLFTTKNNTNVFMYSCNTYELY